MAASETPYLHSQRWSSLSLKIGTISYRECELIDNLRVSQLSSRAAPERIPPRIRARTNASPWCVLSIRLPRARAYGKLMPWRDFCKRSMDVLLKQDGHRKGGVFFFFLFHPFASGKHILRSSCSARNRLAVKRKPTLPECIVRHSELEAWKRK